MLRHPQLFFLTSLLLAGQSVPLDVTRLDLKNVHAEVTTHKGSRAIKLAISDDPAGEGIAIVKGSHFHNGTIEMDVAGAPAKGAGDFARGFIGLVFRVQGDNAHFENIYIRPTNGRAADQLRRNHSTQYTSHPDWPWERLRKETPGVYESYVDLVPDEWTHLRVVVTGVDASLYVGSAQQPCLLVHDLKLGDLEGSVGLWIGPGTDGYFRDIRIQ